MNAPEMKQLPAGHDRRRYLGGGDAAALLGLSPWATPLDLFYKKLSDEPEEISDEKAKFFRNRKAQEPIIAGRLEREYGIVVTKLSLDENPNRYVDPEYPFMVAEIDFEFRMTQIVRDCFPERDDFAEIPDGTLLNGEIKTVSPFSASKWGEQGSEQCPDEYAAQCMWGLGVTNRPACLLVALFGIDDLLCWPIMADQETITAMRSKAVTFWTENVLKQVAPEPINVDDVLKLYAGFNGKPVALSDEAYEALRSLDNLRAQVRTFESNQQELEWRIARCVAFEWGAELQASKSEKPVISASENAVLMYAGTKAGTWNRQSRVGIDVKRLREEKPEIASAYSTESQFRVFRVTKSKGA